MKYLILFFSLLVVFNSFAQDLSSEKRVLKLMGCRFELTATAIDEGTAKSAIQVGVDEISRIEKLISEWDSTSQTSEINRYAGIKAVKVDQELFDLIFRSTKISQISGGAFDISFASMDKIWIFDKAEHSMPDSSIVAKAREKVDYQKIILNRTNQTVYLSVKGMKIGFGGIGKGYAANKAKALMEKIPGVEGGVVNASGDMYAWGKSNHPDGWSVQITDPKDKTKFLGCIRLNNMSIVTSGDYEKYFYSNGIRYAHIINPKTGYPITNIKSVTIISPDAEFSDAMATTVCVLGVERGLRLINQLNSIECLIVDNNNDIYTSGHLQINYYK